MEPVIAGEVWHYWIGVVLVAVALLAVVATIVGYLVKVQSMKHPRR